MNDVLMESVDWVFYVEENFFILVINGDNRPKTGWFVFKRDLASSERGVIQQAVELILITVNIG